MIPGEIRCMFVVATAFRAEDLVLLGSLKGADA